ncbi:MAG: hypothetical protein COW00_01815 [Bdellovibrio sp. CG12_big_fil_rev_8_21_14_0_65_39_13]|nr:MAG: hypothetical protein COW78_09755 [Bdellovibrio sp. CG22_combo_CG10-13_8_21_14_all_39_27]PIQ62336.1 MAG: hypothetical protein COW00_01815 [Bdellovibrio sp. CG12_big_fil_rev_8_21_14_0_65_39_13]PIR34277.1 MAG: hypothetical protein COV37_13145 [Bdellovibrio sp. CG11_big_fil_rev_8_21_14_0_20_39_38]
MFDSDIESGKPTDDCRSNQTLLFDNRIIDEWLSTKEAADYLSITPNALRIWVCRGKIKAYKLGNRLRFRNKDLKTFILNGGQV